MKTGYDFIFHGWHIQFNMLLRLCILGDNPQRSQAPECRIYSNMFQKGERNVFERFPDDVLCPF